MKQFRLLINVPAALKAKLDAERKRGTSTAGLIRHLPRTALQREESRVMHLHQEDDMGEVVSLRRDSSQGQRPVTQVHVPLEEAGTANRVMSWTYTNADSYGSIGVSLKPSSDTTRRPIPPIFFQ
jgi:hypothetical protein